MTIGRTAGQSFTGAMDVLVTSRADSINYAQERCSLCYRDCNRVRPRDSFLLIWADWRSGCERFGSNPDSVKTAIGLCFGDAT